jgi:hypothetical protein
MPSTLLVAEHYSMQDVKKLANLAIRINTKIADKL